MEFYHLKSCMEVINFSVNVISNRYFRADLKNCDNNELPVLII